MILRRTQRLSIFKLQGNNMRKLGQTIGCKNYIDINGVKYPLREYSVGIMYECWHIFATEDCPNGALNLQKELANGNLRATAHLAFLLLENRDIFGDFEGFWSVVKELPSFENIQKEVYAVLTRATPEADFGCETPKKKAKAKPMVAILMIILCMLLTLSALGILNILV